MRKLRLFTASMLLAGAAATAHQSTNKAALPDVFLITIDTLRSDHLHCYGHDKIQTPAMDSLAKDGVRFAKAFTPSPITNSSHATILTGLLPSSHGVTDFGVPLEATHRTLAELLRKQGYQTAAFIGSVILDSKALAPGLDRGFDFYDNFPEHSESKARWGRLERRGGDVVQRAEKWLDRHRTGPRFVWVHLYDPHDPYEPPAPYSEIYKDRLYDGEIAYADSALGELLGYLKNHNWYQTALIVLVGDHGEGLGEHREETHGIFLYDTTTHVPLIIREPKNANAERVVAGQVRTTDILPTILDIVGVPLSQGVDGSSLAPMITGGESTNRIALGETDYPLRFGWAPLRSVRNEGFKFIEAPRPELYDLDSDPGEVRNRYAPWDTRAQDARKTLANAMATGAPHRKASPGAVSSNTIDELKALGYLGASDARSSTDVPEPSLFPDPKDKIEEQNFLHIAMMASEDGDTARAKAAFDNVLRADPDSVIALMQVGELEIGSGLYQEAIDHLHHAHELRPSDSNVSLDYARALVGARKFAEAREVLAQSLKVNPQQPEAKVLLASVYFRLNDHDAARDQLASALLAEPGNAKLIKEAAKLLVGEKEFKDATDLLEPIAASSKDPDLLKLLAKAYRGLGRINDAQRVESQANRLQTTAPN